MTERATGVQAIDGQLLKRMIAAGTEVLGQKREEVDALNVFPVPDGDTGTNMHLTFVSANKEAQKADASSADKVAEAAARGALMGARGNSGVIASQLFRGFSQAVKGKKVIDGPLLAEALVSASKTAYKAVMKPVEGTMLTVSRETGEAAVLASKKNRDVMVVAQAALEGSKKSLERTPKILPVLKEAGVVDSGGYGLVVFFEGVLRALKGEEIGVSHIETRATTPSIESEGAMRLEDITFQYCTEFIVQGESIPQETLRKKLDPLGDSLLVVGDENIVKIHVHTNRPGKALDICTDYGELLEVHIHNMIQQFKDAMAEGRSAVIDPSVARQENKIEAPTPAPVPRKPLGLVSVAMGDGLAEIFTNLGADQVVLGGQTMNPATADLLEAVEKVNADSVIILPNNKNVITTAEQVQQLTQKKIHVIPTRSIPQGVASLLQYNPEEDPQEVALAMSEAKDGVITGEVTYAVRNTTLNGVEIAEQDIIGLKNGKIEKVGQSIPEVATDLITDLGTDAELITLYYGADVTEEDASALAERINQVLPDAEVEIYRGGQPLYYYLFSIE